MGDLHWQRILVTVRKGRWMQTGCKLFVVSRRPRFKRLKSTPPLLKLPTRDSGIPNLESPKRIEVNVYSAFILDCSLCNVLKQHQSVLYGWRLREASTSLVGGHHMRYSCECNPFSFVYVTCGINQMKTEKATNTLSREATARPRRFPVKTDQEFHFSVANRPSN